MSITRSPRVAAGPVMDAEALLKEARRRGRRRRQLLLGAVVLAAAMVAVAVTAIGARSPARPSRTWTGSPIPAGTAATVNRLGRGSSIWVVDMLSLTRGFAIAGQAGRDRAAYLVATADGGRSWTVRSRLPYALTDDGFSVPSLAFLDAQVGYTQSGIANGTVADRGVYVTTDGGLRWHALALDGSTPTAAGDNLTAGSVNESYQVAGHVLSLVALRCTNAELDQGGSVCPSSLERFEVGATRPFATWPIPAMGSQLPQGGRIPSDRLLAAVGPGTVIVAQGDLEAWSPVLISRDGGRHWARLSTPCGSLHVGRFDLQLPIQELDVFASNRWVLDCYQGGGMSQGSIVVSVSSDQGRSWRLLAEGSMGAGAGGIPYVGTIGDVDETLWASHDGRTLWAWDSIQGWFSESTDGGRDWRMVRAASGGGGPPTADLSPRGARGAILIVLGRAFETTDGTRWRHVRLLPVS